jgi:sarcosine oxidase
MQNHYDVIIIGLGSMGSSACYHLAGMGLKILGVDRHNVPHDKGSHTGHSRIIRKAYFEHPDYIPLLDRAYSNWYHLEEKTGEKLFYKTGLFYAGLAADGMISGIRKSSELYHVPIQNWSQSDAAKNFPQFNIPELFDIIFEENAGFVLPAKTIELYVRMSRQAGAHIMENSKVDSWSVDGSGYVVVVNENKLYADKLVFCAGAWTHQLLNELNVKLEVTHQPLAWTRQTSARYKLGQMPCFMIEDQANMVFYGFPDLSREKLPGPKGLKVALHHPGESIDPDEMKDEMSALEQEILVDALSRYIPSASRSLDMTQTCLYTYSPDTHFIIDFLPGHEQNVAIATGFSGHGFKFSPGVGEALSGMIYNGKKDNSIKFLGLQRFNKKASN